MCEPQESDNIKDHLTEKEINELFKLISENGIEKYKIKIESGSKKGDNYIGRIYKIIVRNLLAKNPQCLHLIIKCSIRDLEYRKLLSIEKYYKREFYMYSIVLKEFERLQSMKNMMNHVFKNYPIVFKACNEINSEFFIMNDLVSESFSKIERQKPLDLKHAKLFMKTIGKFHALSFALKKTDRVLYESITSNLDEIFLRSLDGRKIEEQFNSMYENICNYFNKTNDNGIILKLKHLLNNLPREIIELTDITKNDEYAVIAHGDCWNNNFLFKYEDKDDPTQPTQLYFIDFQESRYTTPVYDLANFFCSNLDYFTCHNYFNLLIDIYYDSLKNFLKQMNYDVDELFPFHIFQKHIQKYFRVGVGIALIQIPLLLTDENDVVDFESLIEDGFSKLLNLEAKSEDHQLRQRIEGLIRFVYERNLI